MALIQPRATAATSEAKGFVRRSHHQGTSRDRNGSTKIGTGPDPFFSPSERGQTPFSMTSPLERVQTPFLRSIGTGPDPFFFIASAFLNRARITSPVRGRVSYAIFILNARILAEDRIRTQMRPTIAMHIQDIFQASPTTFSFEFFPPKTDKASEELFGTIPQLQALQPSFVSVTYGAGGSTRRANSRPDHAHSA